MAFSPIERRRERAALFKGEEEAESSRNSDAAKENFSEEASLTSFRLKH